MGFQKRCVSRVSNFFKVAGIILAVLIIIGLGAYIWLTNTAERNLSLLVYEDVDMNMVTGWRLLWGSRCMAGFCQGRSKCEEPPDRGY